MQIRKFSIRFQRISHILISHLHGDHYLGLIGLLSTLHLNGRTKEMHIIGPPELKEIIEKIHFRKPWLAHMTLKKDTFLRLSKTCLFF